MDADNSVWQWVCNGVTTVRSLCVAIAVHSAVFASHSSAISALCSSKLHIHSPVCVVTHVPSSLQL